MVILAWDSGTSRTPVLCIIENTKSVAFCCCCKHWSISALSILANLTNTKFDTIIISTIVPVTMYFWLFSRNKTNYNKCQSHVVCPATLLHKPRSAHKHLLPVFIKEGQFKSGSFSTKGRKSWVNKSFHCSLNGLKILKEM